MPYITAHDSFESMPDTDEHPVAEAQLARLPRLPFSEYAGKDTTCTVCQCDFAAETQLLVLPCTHALCADGCSDWLRHRNSCPVCRRRVPTGEPGLGWGEPDATQWENPAAEAAAVEADRGSRWGAQDAAQWEHPGGEAVVVAEDPVVRGSGGLFIAQPGPARTVVERTLRPDGRVREVTYHLAAGFVGFLPVVIESAVDGEEEEEWEDDCEQGTRPRNGSMGSGGFELEFAPPGFYNWG